MVLDNGKLVSASVVYSHESIILTDAQVEFDSPLTLLNMKGGYFKSLVDSSGDKASLYAMAEAKSGGSY